MKSGQCPKCGSRNVYHEMNGIYTPKTLGTFVRTTDGGNVGSASEDYLCTDCGYYERYISDRDRLKAVTKAWKKVG